MIHAIVLLAGLCAFWLALSANVSMPNLLIGAAALLATLGFAWRAGALDREGAPYARLPHHAALAIAGAPRALREALRIGRCALAGWRALKPGLVRVRTQADAIVARTSFAHAIGASGAAIVVETNAEALLLHALDEERMEAAELAALERGAIAAAGGGA